MQSPEDFIYATLTDEEIIGDAMGIFQQVYPNTVKIDYDNSHTKEIEQVDLSHIVENKSFSELISDFYPLMYQCEISEMCIRDRNGKVQKTDSVPSCGR